MTQYTAGKFGAGKLAIAVATLILAAVIGFRFVRDRAAVAAPPPVLAAAADSPPSIDALELRAKANPGDSSAWQALGGAYFDSGRYDDAAGALARAAEISPSTAVLWSSLGEAQVMASKANPLPAQAAADFERAIALDPGDPRARYFLAVKKDLAGQHEAAIRDWLALLADTPPGAPWQSDLRRTIEQVGRINRIEVASRIAGAGQRSASTRVASPAIPGPSQQDLQAAAAMPPSQQREMADAMVARLEGRLRSQPRDIEGWIMLMRSRMMLGQPDKASAALLQAIAANPNKAERLKQEAALLGVR